MNLSRHSETLNFFRSISDIISIILAWILSFIIRFNTEIIAVTRGHDTLLNYIRLLPLLILSYVFVFFSQKVGEGPGHFWRDH